MRRYAQDTNVPVDKSIGEIKRLLERYGAKQIAYGQDTEKGFATIQFAAHERHIKFSLALPNPGDREFARSPGGRKTYGPAQRHAAWEQACRQRWRSLFLCIKAKLASIEDGIETFETAFLAHVVLPGGWTVGEFMAPQIENAARTGQLPRGITGLLGHSPDPRSEDADFEVSP